MTGVVENVSRMLPEPEAAALLASFGIPYVEHDVARTADAAVEAAAAIGYPVVLKVVSPDVVHKTEAGGVLLGLKDEWGLREGYDELIQLVRASCPDARIDGVLVCRHVPVRCELIVGAVYDAVFGPTVMVGLGGVFAEALADVVFRVVPLTRRDGLEMVRELRGAGLLATFRGEGPVDLDAVAGILVHVADSMLGHPEISEIDLNPVAASADGCVALDARIIVRGGFKMGF